MISFCCDFYLTPKQIKGLNSQWTPLNIRITNRQFNIPLDAPVHSPITRVYIVDGAKRPEDINVTLTRASFEGPFYFAHDYFELYPLKDKGSHLQFELQLKKPLIDKFKAHDQVNLLENIFSRQTETRIPKLVNINCFR